MTTPMSSVIQATREMIEESMDDIIYKLAQAGEECVNEARNAGSYSDQTGNLRSSVGYAIFVDGQPYQIGHFDQVQGPKGNNGEGVQSGQEFALSLADEFPSGIVLVVVAGMKYASYVADKGKDVIQSAETFAEHRVPELLAQLGIGKGGKQ